jgi:ferric-dicitrate binding protein FerR (iron transport regulator)
MSQRKSHHEMGETSWEELGKLNAQLEIPFGKTKADVWAEMETQIDTATQPKKISLLSRPVFRLAMAASVVLLLGVVGLMRFYTTTVETQPGHQQLVNLPDGSAVRLNAVSTISYHPYWWRFSRVVALRGEAFFEVEKGSRFMVSSERANTTVLGTSFNIYSRNEDYRVSCLTGKVRVHTKNDEAVLSANEKAELKEGGTFEVLKNISFEAEAAWINNEFNFRNKPLKEAFEEIERQYGVVIEGKNILNNETLDARISGHIERKDNSANDLIEMICTIYKFDNKSDFKSYNLNFEKIKENEYRIFISE